MTEPRQQLTEAGILGGKEVQRAILRPLPFTDAEKRNPALYQDGMVVQFHQHARGIASGSRLDVQGVAEDGTPLLAARDGSLWRVSLDEAGKFSLFQKDTLAIRPGETLRITQNGQTKDGKHRLHNGAVYEVKSIGRKGDVTLSNGWKIDRDFGGIGYGYVTTSHSAQRRTVDRVFIAQDGFSGRASSAEQLYVSLSRGRERATIYTGDAAALREAVQQSSSRLSATEMARGMSRSQRLQAYVRALDNQAHRRDGIHAMPMTRRIPERTVRGHALQHVRKGVDHDASQLSR